MAKYNQNLVEAYNLISGNQEKPELRQRIKSICNANVELVQKHYGAESIYCVRPFYTRFTQSLTEKRNELIKETIDTLGQMKMDGQAVKANHFIYKTLIINTMMAMQ